MIRFWICCLLFCASAAFAEDVLVVEQDYDILEEKSGGPEAKDVRQKLYLCRDYMCIDEYGGKAGDERPTESFLIDFKNKQIIDLNHIDKKKLTETFDARRKRIESRKDQAEKDLAAETNPTTKQKLEKLFRSLLDDSRNFALAENTGALKTILGKPCKTVKVLVENMPDYLPLEATLHPDLELPYDNAEVLYLLQVIGLRMSKFLGDHRGTFKYIPMELHLDLAAGGRLDTKVVGIAKIESSQLNAKSRGGLGNPFETPPYEEQVKRPMRKTEKKSDERAD